MQFTEDRTKSFIMSCGHGAFSYSDLHFPTKSPQRLRIELDLFTRVLLEVLGVPGIDRFGANRRMVGSIRGG